MRKEIVLALLATVSVALVGCSKGEKVQANSIDPAKVKVEEAPDVNVVEVDHPEQFRLTTVEAQPAMETLQVTGSVAPDVSRNVPVVSLSAGRVVEIRARLGDDVRKGDVLLTMSSPDVAQAFADLQKFQADEVLARRQMERADLLFSKGAIAQKDVQIAEDTEQKAKVDVATARERIRILGADINHPSSLIEIKAPVSGTLVEQNVTNGAGVKSLDNSPNLFTIADLSHIWILCDVFENDLSKVHLGDTAEVRLNAFPDRPLRARVSNIGRVLDPNTRSAKVRLELPNSGGILKPNMFASVMFSGRSSQQRPVVPASAVLQLHDKTWVFKPTGDHRFRREEVHIGNSGKDGKQVVLAGLSPGDRIVENALQFATAADSKN